MTALAACGGGDSSSSSSGKEDPEAAQAACERFEPLLEPVTELATTTPLTKKPDEGKLAYLIRFNNSAAAPADKPFKEAMEDLDWNGKILATDAADPQGTSNAIKQAISAGADYIMISSTDTSTIGPGLDAAMKAEVPIFGMAAVADVGGEGNGVYGNVSDVDGTAEMFSALTEWAACDGKGTSEILFVTYPDAPILAATAPKVIATGEEHCPACTIHSMPITTSQLLSGGELISAVVAEVRKNPGVEYVTMDVNAAGLGLREALDAAGLNDVKIGLSAPGPEHFDGLRAGKYDVAVGFAFPEQVYASVDQMARLSVGMDGDQETHATTSIRAFYPDTADGVEELPAPEGYREKFRELWNVG